jgi:hypothetical protein
MMPDELVLHLLQKKRRLGRRQCDGANGVDDLVLDCLNEAERGLAAAEPVENGVGGRVIHAL